MIKFTRCHDTKYKRFVLDIGKLRIVYSPSSAYWFFLSFANIGGCKGIQLALFKQTIVIGYLYFRSKN